MAPSFSKMMKYVPPKNIAMMSGAAIVVYLVGFKKNSQKTAQAATFVSEKKGDTHSKEKIHVDKTFLKHLMRILKILIPNFFCKELGFVVLIAFMLVLRTRFDVWMIENGTAIESAIIDRNKGRFLTHLFRFIYTQPGIALTNQLLKYGLNSLKLRFRMRFTMSIYKSYLSGHTYYKMSNIDNRIANADQLITQDVERFCNSLVDLYSNLSKPLLDMVIYIYRLNTTIGPQGPASMIAYLVVSGIFLNKLRRPIGKFTVTEQRLEGEYRYVNSRLITNSEEIAFYNGNEKERETVTQSFFKLFNHLKGFLKFRFRMGIIDDIIAKYTATTIGYLIVSRPFLDMNYEKFKNASQPELLENYYRSGRMLVRLAQAMGRIVLAGREMSRLAGFTARVTELMNVTDELNNGVYKRTMISNSGNNSRRTRTNGGSGSDSDVVITDGEDETQQPQQELVPGSGNVVLQDNIIRFDKVPLVTPNGDVLVREMSFEVRSGLNVIICGPNGCGKSSLFRVLGELWPLFGGTLVKPHRSKLFYVPQRPYMTLGTLRDQIIYPHTKKEMTARGYKDSDLEEYLQQVQMMDILKNNGGWDSVEDWMDVLSGGEKQRVAMARLFYHKPQFAILDECTSAVSVDVEGFMYRRCREIGITLFTVSHRKSLWVHHEYYLYMDGRGKYEFKSISDGMSEPFGS